MTNFVFVYGTLKPGEFYEHVAQKAGTFKAEKAFVEGYRIYHLREEKYPAVIAAPPLTDELLEEELVFGYVLEYENIEAALDVLDELEGINLDPPEYNRAEVKVTRLRDDEEINAWMYTFAKEEYLTEQHAQHIPYGNWTGIDKEDVAGSVEDIADESVAAHGRARALTLP